MFIIQIIVAFTLWLAHVETFTPEIVELEEKIAQLEENNKILSEKRYNMQHSNF